MCNLKKKKKSTLNVTSVRENDFQKNSFLPPLSLSLFHVDRGSFLFSLCISELSKDRPTSKYAGQRAGRLRQPTDWNRRAATASATSATAIATNASSAGSHAAIQGQSESGGEPANRGTQERKSSASRRFYSEYIYTSRTSSFDDIYDIPPTMMSLSYPARVESKRARSSNLLPPRIYDAVLSR